MGISIPTYSRPSSGRDQIKKTIAMQTDFGEQNIAICKRNHPYLNIAIPRTHTENRVVLLNAKQGSPIFGYKLNEHNIRHFHSLCDPVSEAEKWADESVIHENSLIIILGSGFFFHISALIKRIPDSTTIIIVEKDGEILLNALMVNNITDVLARENLYVCAGGSSADAVRFILEIQTGTKIDKTTILKHPPSIQTFPDFYQTIIKAFGTDKKINLFDRLKYKKFSQKDEPKVLLLTTKYFLMGEIISAMERRGVKYRLATIMQDELGSTEFIEQIIKTILEFKPDFLFTINHLGLDREGVLAGFLEKIEMPFASWYVDNPNLIIKQYNKNVTPYCTLFLWDKNNISDMKKLNFEHTFYLPLGVDERRFRPICEQANPFAPITPEVSFVGNSMAQKVRECLKKTGVNGSLAALFHNIAIKYMESPDRHIDNIIKRTFPHLHHEFSGLKNPAKSNYEAAVSWEATRVYRLDRILRLLEFHPVIAGDQYWAELIDSKYFRYHRELTYYDELPFFYNASTINFNATSRQMKGAVNQRVFDVPACNKFLLTDYQDQLEDLFKIGEEIICYHDPAEIPDLVGYYLNHPSDRICIAKNGYKRVLRDHTYVSRVGEMIDIMKKVYQ